MTTSPPPTNTTAPKPKTVPPADTKPSQKSTAAPKPAQAGTEARKTVAKSRPPNKKKPKAAPVHGAYALPSPKELARKARSIRKKRVRKLILQLGLFVLLPTLLSVVYHVFVASDMYESNASFTIQTTQTRNAIGIETLIGGIVGSGSARDSWTVREYILSREMLSRLEADHQFIAHYQKQKNDFWSRLTPHATFEESFVYYLKMVNVDHDTTSGILTLRVRSYDPQWASRFSKAILDYTENMVNDMSAVIQQDQVDYARKAVRKAEERLAAATNSVLNLQRQNADFSPDRSAASLLTIKGQLESELARTQAELNSAQAIMQPTAPQVVALSQKVRSLQQQIRREQRKLVGSEDDDLSSSIVQFETALMEKEFAQTEYASTMTALEMAQMEASRKSRYLSIISNPSLPDEAAYPRKVINTITIFLLSLALYGICTLMIAAVREHARI